MFSNIPIGSAVAVQHEDSSPWIHGTVVGKGDHNHHGRSYFIQLTHFTKQMAHKTHYSDSRHGGKRSFICRSSLGGQWFSVWWFYFFQFLAFCGIFVDVLIYGGTVCLPKHFFQNGLCFRDCDPCEIYIS